MAKILIVDDSPVNLKIIGRLLGTEYDIITAEDGRAAIRLAMERKPDLILLDVIMPEMDGLTVCRYLKEQALTAEIPVIFITVVSESNNIVKGFEAGGQDYITKPFGPQELRARIKTHLELKESKEALKAYAKQLEAKNAELNEALNKLEIIASTDYLTKLANRRYMMQKINEEVARLKQAPGNMTLILADIDAFKEINDSYGHDSGDWVLKAVADAMKNAIREHDVISRWGGDEFLIMLPGTDIHGGQIIAERIRRAVKAAIFRVNEQNISVTITLGVAEFDSRIDIDTNIKRADGALYKGKMDMVCLE